MSLTEECTIVHGMNLLFKFAITGGLANAV